MPKSKKEEKGGLLYVKAQSLADVLRCACRFDFNSDPLLLYKTKHDSKLIAIGSKVGESTLAYYFPVKATGRMALYTPASEGRAEIASFTDKTDPLGKYYLNVVKADLGELRISKGIDRKSVVLVRFDSMTDLVSIAIKKNAKEESLAQLYSFNYNGKQVVGGFEIVDGISEGKTSFCYAFGKGKTNGFARYDYRESRVDFTDIMGEHAYMYAKVINLAEPYPFFKPR